MVTRAFGDRCHRLTRERQLARSKEVKTYGLGYVLLCTSECNGDGVSGLITGIPPFDKKHSHAPQG
jgi:hypothetical protein